MKHLLLRKTGELVGPGEVWQIVGGASDDGQVQASDRMYDGDLAAGLDILREEGWHTAFAIGDNQILLERCEHVDTAPAIKYLPRLFRDGNAWCALYGDNLQEGVAGFGSSPALAMDDFDRAWNTSIDS